MEDLSPSALKSILHSKLAQLYYLQHCAAWVLGLPHGLAVLHGKTRSGGLVFDIGLTQNRPSSVAPPCRTGVLPAAARLAGTILRKSYDIADIVKDAMILPQAFIAAMAGESEQEFRQRVISSFNRAEALDVMIDAVKATALACSEVGK